MKNIFGKLFLAVLIVGVIGLSFIRQLSADASPLLSESQMATMLGGGFECPDKDCDTAATACPGGNTCAGIEARKCYTCSSTLSA
jgi:hypothetical protein